MELDRLEVVLVDVEAHGALLVVLEVGGQRGFERKPLRAEAALERFLLGVSLYMGVQVALLGKPLVTKVTVIGLFPRVEPQMGDKVALLREAFLADLTVEGPVGLVMFLGRRLVLKVDVTGAAVGWRVGRRCPVGRGRAPLVARLVIG